MTFQPVEIIKKKREGKRLSKTELEQLVKRYISGQIPDYQMSAFLMSVFFRGMETDEMSSLVEIMRDSGTFLQLDDLDGIKIDKHSTGGVGDKISLILAPLLACFNIYVPMISGRSLGHSGGTLDKLEAIPGLKTRISLPKFKKVLKDVGFVIAGQTDEIVPADRKIYALRDATATIESLPLVVASIMSKKLAEDLDGLVLDIKTGKGAFFPKKEEAILLASHLVQVGENFGLDVLALLTNMDQPLGFACGNWIEVVEAIKCLQGEGPEDTMQEVYALAIRALRIAGRNEETQVLFSKLKKMINNGKAFEKFVRYVGLMGGDVKKVDNPDLFSLPIANPIYASHTGYITDMDAYKIGIASMLCGAGRLNQDSDVDPSAGIQLKVKIGDFVNQDDLVAEIFTHKDNIVEISQKVQEAIQISEQQSEKYQLVFGEIDRSGKLISLEDFSVGN